MHFLLLINHESKILYMRLEKIEYNFNIFKPHDYKIIYYMLYTLLYIWRVTRREIN